MNKRIIRKPFWKKVHKKDWEDKRHLLLGYAKYTYIYEKRFLSKREIRKTFGLELYNYFESLFDLYQHLNIDIPLEYCPRWLAKQKIIDFVCQQSKKGLYPLKTELEKHWNIQIYTYFRNIHDIYKHSNVDYDLYLERKKKIENPIHSPEKVDENISKIIQFIQSQIKKGFYPGVSKIQDDLGLAFYRYFDNIYQAYEKANAEYVRICPIILGRRKEKILTDIAKKLLVKMGFEIDRVSIETKIDRNTGPDITISKNGVKFLVEIKAYRRDYSITNREFNQLLKYMSQSNQKRSILITTSRTKKHYSSKIQLINGDKLILLLRRYGMENELEIINWIQTARANNLERRRQKDHMRKRIVDFVLSRQVPTKKEIEKELKIDLRTYFSRKSPYKDLIDHINSFQYR